MSVGRALALLALSALAVSAEVLVNPLPLSDWTNGSAIFWGGPQDGQDDPYNMRLPGGACGYGEMDSKLWPFYYVTGIAPTNELVVTRPQASCGTCLEVQCVATKPGMCVSNRTITLVVTDECVQCASTELNMHAFAFEQIAKLKFGGAGIRYRQVECAPVDNISVRVDGFRVAQGGWIRLSFKSVASDAGITKVELARSSNATTAGNATAGTGNATAAGTFLTGGDGWKSMDNTYGAEWELSSLPAPPYDLRVTDSHGRKVLLPRAITTAGATGEFPGRGQFPGLPNNASAEVTKKPFETQFGNTTITPSNAKPAVPAAAAAAVPAAKPATAAAAAAKPATGKRRAQRRALRQATRGEAAGPLP